MNRAAIGILLTLAFYAPTAEGVTLRSFAAVGGPLCCNGATMRITYGIGVIGAEPAYQGASVQNDLFFSLNFCGLQRVSTWTVPVLAFGSPDPAGISGFIFINYQPPVPPFCPIDAKAGMISQVGGVGILPLVADTAESACFSPCDFCPPGTGEI